MSETIRSSLPLAFDIKLVDTCARRVVVSVILTNNMTVVDSCDSRPGLLDMYNLNRIDPVFILLEVRFLLLVVGAADAATSNFY